MRENVQGGHIPMARFRWLGAFGVCFSLCMAAQETPPPPASSGQSTPSGPPVSLIPRSHEEREQRYQANHRVILNVRVTDAAGKPVTGLKEDDFTLLDETRPQKIVSFRAVHGAADSTREHVLLVLDSLNNSPRNFGFERKGIERFLRQNQGQLPYPMAIVLLSASGTKASQPSRDPGFLIEELRKLSDNLHQFGCGDDEDDTGLAFVSGVGMPTLPTSRRAKAQSAQALDCLNQRFRGSVSTLDRLAREQVEIPGQALVIWAGPGWPTLTGGEFLPDSPAMRHNYFAYLADLSTSLREAQVTLNAVSSPNLTRDVGFELEEKTASLDRAPKADEATAGNFALPVLAYQTGGQVLVDKDIAADIAACIKDAESYYAVSFDSAPTIEGPQYHSIQVRVNQPGLTVRTTTAYYSQP
jgi:VWFA-related protein